MMAKRKPKLFDEPDWARWASEYKKQQGYEPGERPGEDLVAAVAGRLRSLDRAAAGGDTNWVRDYYERLDPGRSEWDTYQQLANDLLYPAGRMAEVARGLEDPRVRGEASPRPRSSSSKRAPSRDSSPKGKRTPTAPPAESMYRDALMRDSDPSQPKRRRVPAPEAHMFYLPAVTSSTMPLIPTAGEVEASYSGQPTQWERDASGRWMPLEPGTEETRLSSFSASGAGSGASSIETTHPLRGLIPRFWDDFLQPMAGTVNPAFAPVHPERRRQYYEDRQETANHLWRGIQHVGDPNYDREGEWTTRGIIPRTYDEFAQPAVGGLWPQFQPIHPERREQYYEERQGTTDRLYELLKLLTDSTY